MPDHNAAKSVHQYLLAENIHIDFEEFSFQVTTHPDYPAVLAYSDALHFFGISNAAVRLTNDEIAALPQQFIALMVDFDEQEMLAFVQRKGDQFQFVKNGKLLQFTQATFEKNWKQVILLVEGHAEHNAIKAPQQKNNQWLLLGGVLLLLTGWFWTVGFALLPSLLLLAIATGLYLAILATKAELMANGAQQSLFCTALPNGDCNAVIGSAKGVLLNNIKISDACIVFFSAQLIAFLFFALAGWLPAFYTFTFMSLLAALPITLYSIYLQAAIAKKWCAICLAIIGIVYLQLVIAWWTSHIGFEKGWIPQALLYIAFFIMALAAWLLIKPLLLKHKELKSAYQKAISFKRNYELFRYLLLQNPPVDLSTAQSPLLLGNTAAPLRITLITNPFCGHCAATHEIMLQLLNSYGVQLSIAIRFNYTAAADPVQKALHYQLVQLYQAQGATVFIAALSEWFQHKNYEQWAAIYGIYTAGDDATRSLLQEQAAWNQEWHLNFTPAFLIGPYLYPAAYGREELLHFIPELIEDETLPLVTN